MEESNDMTASWVSLLGEGEREVGVRPCVGGLQVDGGAEVVEGAGVLPRGQVHHAQVVGDDPLEGREVHGTLQARHRRHVLALIDIIIRQR